MVNNEEQKRIKLLDPNNKQGLVDTVNVNSMLPGLEPAP